MSLFVGNLSKNVVESDFYSAFKAFGNCKIDLRIKYSFVVYDHDADAERALKELNNADICGHRINVEWSKQSGRFDEN